MGRVADTVNTVNTTLRTLLMLVLVGFAGVGGYKAYDVYNEPRKQLEEKQNELDKTVETLKKANADLEIQKQEIDTLNTSLTETTQQLEKVEFAMRLLKVRHRLARLTVLDQRPIEASDTAALEAAAAGEPAAQVMTKIEFVEINEAGEPISEPREFDIVGDMVYVDYLRVTFDDKYVEQSYLDRSTAIALFQRIFGEHQKAIGGYTLDTVGTRPTAYGQGTDISDFEKKIWDDFWLIANDKQKAADLGIFAAHSNAVGIRVQPNMVYEIDLRSTGDMTIRPIDPQRAAVNANPAPAPPPN